MRTLERERRCASVLFQSASNGYFYFRVLPYSLDRNKLGNQKSDKKPPKTSTGRRPAEAKEHLVSDTVEVYPQDVDRDQCIHHRFQSAWRIVDGKAVYLRYDIRDLADSTSLPLPPGVRNSRSEFGMEVLRSFTKEDRSDERARRFL